MKVLVVVASGLHLGYIGCYGNEWIETPALDRLAAEGVVFDQHYADQPDAAGAQRAWQTACYQFPTVKPEEHPPCHDLANFFALLGERDIATFLIHDEMSHTHPALRAGWKYSRLLGSTSGVFLLPEHLSDVLRHAVTHLSPCQQWLLRFDLSTTLQQESVPHEFIANQEEEDEPLLGAGDSDELLEPEDLAYCQLQDNYSALVKRLDTILGSIVEHLEQRGLLEEMVVLVTSDRGLRLGEEQSRPRSRLFLHEELIHLPLILRLPGKAQAGRRIAALTQPVDVLPTLFDVFGVPLPAVQGYSLLPLANGEIDRVRPYACAGLCTSEGVEWALRSPDWAFLLPMSNSSSEYPIEPELYLKPEDRWEVNNVRQHHLEFAESLEQTLRRFVEATCRPGPLEFPDVPHPEQEPAKEQDHLDSAERSIPR